MDTFVIFNADDLGASTGINRGILECHCHGVVTSASLMVTGRAAKEAAAMIRDYPSLSVGLHWDVCGEDEREFDLSNEHNIREEFQKQLDEFSELMGRSPTHIDSHRHVHRDIFPLFRELTAHLGVPLRFDGKVRTVGHFYGQWEWLITDLDHIGTPYLLQLLREEARPGWNEFSCHPGYRSPDFQSVYMTEREIELKTLTDPAIKDALSQLNIRLVNYHDFFVVA